MIRRTGSYLSTLHDVLFSTDKEHSHHQPRQIRRSGHLVHLTFKGYERRQREVDRYVMSMVLKKAAITLHATLIFA